MVIHMISKRTQTSLLSAALAIPPALLIAAFANKVMPTLEPASSTVGADEQNIATLPAGPAHSRPVLALQAR